MARKSPDTAPVSTARRVRLPDGRMLGYADWGDPAGAPVIYCHGGLSSRLDVEWASSICAERGVRLIAPDRPGLGLSSMQQNRTLLDWPKDVMALADGLGIKKFAVLGWSLGAIHAMACAYGIPPERLTRTAAVGGVVPLTDAAGQGQVGFLTDRILGALSGKAPWLAGALLMFSKQMPPAVVKWSLLRDLSPADKAVVSPLSAHDATAFFYESLRQGPAGQIQEYRVMYAPWGFRLEDIGGEMQIWQGEDDSLALPVNGPQLAARIPHSMLTTVPNAGHFLLHTNTAKVLDALIA